MQKKGKQVHRGEIVWCDLGEAIGSEQGGCRPVVVVQNDVGNTYSTTTIVVPLTTKIKKTTLPTHYQFVNNQVSQVACAEQIRTVDKVRLGSSLGFVRKEDVDAISRCVQIAVGEIEFVPRTKTKLRGKVNQVNPPQPENPVTPENPATPANHHNPGKKTPPETLPNLPKMQEKQGSDSKINPGKQEPNQGKNPKHPQNLPQKKHKPGGDKPVQGEKQAPKETAPVKKQGRYKAPKRKK